MKTLNIAAVVSGLDEEYPYYIIKGINDFARKHNMNVSYFAAFGGVVDSRRFDIGEFSIYNLTDFTKFDGALLLTNTFADPKIRSKITEKVKAAGIPTVVFESKEYPEFYDVSIDNFTVMKELVDHVIKHHNCKTVNYISGPMPNPEAKARYDAFVCAMRENGLDVDNRRIYYGYFRSYDGVMAIEDFKKSGLSLPDAFICANDSMALTALSALEKMGYKVPDDVIVTGFDNTINARNSTPALTTVRRPVYTSGVKAAEVLYNLLNGVEQPKSTVMEPNVIFSESCGCPLPVQQHITDFKKNTYQRIERNNANVHMINRLTAALAEAETAEECYDRLSAVMPQLECEKFCLCLVADWDDSFNSSSVLDDNEYPELMTAPLIWENGKRRSVDCFLSREMFPEKQETGGNINYFLPLHFGERCLGYYVMTNSDFPIYSLLCHTFTMCISNSIENISKLNHINKAMDELNRLYVIDPLCGIYNRNGFINVADHLFHDCINNQRPIMMSFIDMDRLKFINDNYGHKEGDEALKRLAAALKESCGKHSVYARFGGDEFIIFTADVNESTQEALEKRFLQSIDNANKYIRKPYRLSASIGSVIVVPQQGDTLYSIITQADEKMYRVKRNKKKSEKDGDR